VFSAPWAVSSPLARACLLSFSLLYVSLHARVLASSAAAFLPACSLRGSPLVFHRDSTYFDFAPADVVTVWLVRGPRGVLKERGCALWRLEQTFYPDRAGL
jgi:hypothetical protein